MPRFFFHLRNDLDVPDDEGRELADLLAARQHAVCLVQFEIAEGAKRDARIVLSHRIEIEDEQGRVLDTGWFRDVIQVEA